MAQLQSTSVTGSLIVTGQITAQSLNVSIISSSVIYSSGSNIFGCSLSNTQQFTGSVSMTGSLSVFGASTFDRDITVNGVNIGEGGGSISTNTRVGEGALGANTTGNFNTAIGRSALTSNSTGQYNTALGTSALAANTTGGSNVALGLNALSSNTTTGNNPLTIQL